jgi:NADPH-dependent 2,4-dienoyl-CoA reductase/sulfur reductase-like enzyme/CRP-like cAMP-binding protein/Fe-S-cluster-containing hydrogenase component 2
MSKQLSYVIIGNGITGVTAAEILRREDPTSALTMIADDPFPVYYRPALKDYLAGRISEEKLWARPHSFYKEQRICFIPGRVVGINPMQHFVWLQNGQQIGYHKLLLAHGARPRQLSHLPVHLSGVTTLRTVTDYQNILRRLPTVARIVVYGGGTLALESAEVLNHRGYEVTHLLRNTVIWSEVLDATASDLVLQEERRAGITVRTGEAITEIVGKDGQVVGVITSSGAHLPCDLLLIAIGIEPLIDIVQASGIACGRGVKVDDSMRTSVADIYAAGDVIETTDALTKQTRVIGQWYPALQQARTAAYSMLGNSNSSQPFRPGVFYNATFLHGLDFVAIGFTACPPEYAHYFQEVVADPRPRSYRKVLLRNGIPLGALFLGDRRQALAFKRAIDHRISLAPVLNDLFVDNFNLDEWLDSQQIPEAILDLSWQKEVQSPLKEPVVVDIGHRSNLQPLSPKRLRFEIDMCIGCDRCMKACPLPSSSSMRIADLNHATTSEQIADHVARFTRECIMCGSCVPVCPVDTHRDLLMLSLKQRVGNSWDDPVDREYLARILPTGWDIPFLLGRLGEQSIFRDPQTAPERYVLHLCASSRLLSLEPGTTVIREGEYGRHLYLLLEGQLSISIREADEQELVIGVLGRGEHIGEYGMLTGYPSTITARTRTPALILQIPEQAIQRYLELVPQARLYFERLSDTRSIGGILKRMALFQGISDADLSTLISQTQIQRYERGECLFTEEWQGGRPVRETLHIILEGFVKVARLRSGGSGLHGPHERVIAYRQSGDYFAGGLDLLGDGRAVTVRAISRVRVAQVPRPALYALFQRYPEVNQRFATRLQQYRESIEVTWNTATVPALHPATALLSPLVHHGVVEGTDVLVIDLDRCIHCRECEEACARRHGQSRMNRKGMVIGHISIATACRQCQDPVCMLCSRAGIGRLPNGEVYITESCIGCGICAERCPYGAISIVDVANETRTVPSADALSSWQRFNRFFTRGITTERERKRKPLPMAHAAIGAENNRVAPGPLDTPRACNAYDEMRKKVAIKCDLCAGYNDQACVLACPTGAALRVQPVTFFGSTEEILERGNKAGSSSR